MSVRVIHGDCLAEIPKLVAEGITCDAVCCDPPYHLLPTQKRFGAINSAPAQHGRDGAMARLSGGFMGQKWDGGDIAFRPETWATVATILRPGAFLVAFGGTRTYHRMVSAIEDAGFVIQDTIPYLWVYASGFPKRKDMLKPAFEPILCARKVFSASPNWDIIAEFTARLEALLWVTNAHTADKTAGGTDNSARWLVHALQAWSREHFAMTGTSSLQGEVSTSLSIALLWNATLSALSENESTFTTEMESSLTTGLRTLNSWLSEITPASITLAVSRQDGLWPNASTAGNNSNGAPPNWSGIPTVFAAAPVTSNTAIAILSTLADIAASSSLLRPATAASFAQCCVPTALTIERSETVKNAPVLNVAPFLKLSPAEIQSIAAESAWQPPTGLSPDLQPIVLAYKPGGKRTMQVDEGRIGTDGGTQGSTKGPSNGILGNGLNGEFGKAVLGLGRWPANVCHDGSDEVLACFPQTGPSPATYTRSSAGAVKAVGYGHKNPVEQVGYGDAGSAARFFMSAKAGSQDRWGSRHPTVKPVELMKWLVALVTPPGGLCLDPFAGSGTTAVAALATGRSAILIEREQAYYEDIRERLAFYEGGGTHSVQAKNRNRKVDHGPLFKRPYDEEEDAHGSYLDAVRAVGERVRAGAPIPDFFLPAKDAAE